METWRQCVPERATSDMNSSCKSRWIKVTWNKKLTATRSTRLSPNNWKYFYQLNIKSHEVKSTGRTTITDFLFWSNIMLTWCTGSWTERRDEIMSQTPSVREIQGVRLIPDLQAVLVHPVRETSRVRAGSTTTWASLNTSPKYACVYLFVFTPPTTRHHFVWRKLFRDVLEGSLCLRDCDH